MKLDNAVLARHFLSKSTCRDFAAASIVATFDTATVAHYGALARAKTEDGANALGG